MTKANSNGWYGFVKVGETYQYKEDSFTALVIVIEDNSTNDEYRFKLQVQKKTTFPLSKFETFEISHTKNINENHKKMLQLFKDGESSCGYQWIKPIEK